jgi:hypothetical protein
MANGQSPPNLFRVWIHFSKPPLFDPNPLVSHPTVNASTVKIMARDLTYFRATQNVINGLIKRHRHWYSFIHETFAYDIGLWLIGAPYILYNVTVYADKFFPKDVSRSSFRATFFIYSIGIGLILYRTLYGYLKWAFPVNVLKENHDIAATHRVLFAGILVALMAHFLAHLLGFA